MLGKGENEHQWEYKKSQASADAFDSNQAIALIHSGRSLFGQGNPEQAP